MQQGVRLYCLLELLEWQRQNSILDSRPKIHIDYIYVFELQTSTTCYW